MIDTLQNTASIVFETLFASVEEFTYHYQVFISALFSQTNTFIPSGQSILQTIHTVIENIFSENGKLT